MKLTKLEEIFALSFAQVAAKADPNLKRYFKYGPKFGSETFTSVLKSKLKNNDIKKEMVIERFCSLSNGIFSTMECLKALLANGDPFERLFAPDWREMVIFFLLQDNLLKDTSPVELFINQDFIG